MCSTIPSATQAYMALYPEKSSDNTLRIGNVVPDFSCSTTQGDMPSFLEWKKGKWAILFSHPADFTPVCTTEIGRLALKYDALTAMDCLALRPSVSKTKNTTINTVSLGVGRDAFGRPGQVAHGVVARRGRALRAQN